MVAALLHPATVHRHHVHAVLVGTRLKRQLPGIAAKLGLAVGGGADRHEEDLRALQREEARAFWVFAVVADLDADLRAAKVENRKLVARREIELLVASRSAGQVRGQDRRDVRLAVDAEALAVLVRDEARIVVAASVLFTERKHERHAVVDGGLEDRRELGLVERDEELVVVAREPVGEEGREEELREA